MPEPPLFNRNNERTEKGYTEAMRKAILGKENEIRKSKDEVLYAFSPRGEVRYVMQGNGAKVEGNPNNIPENSIIIHNHPRSLGASGILRIGNSFSATDLMTAVRRNAKEMRAVTPTYTFSMKRPKGGWKATPEEVRSAFNRIHWQTQDEFIRYVGKRGNSEAAIRRATVMHYHRVNQRLAKEFGWNYTKKNK